MLIYARRRGLSNRPARGAFKLRSGTGDCGGEVQREPGGGLIAQCRMRALRVVVGSPGFDQISGMGDVVEQRLVQKLVPHSAVGTFDEAVLHGLARCDVVPLNLVLCAPLQDRVRGQFGAVALREPALLIGYGRARSPQIAQRMAITGSQVSTVVLHKPPRRGDRL